MPLIGYDIIKKYLVHRLRNHSPIVARILEAPEVNQHTTITRGNERHYAFGSLDIVWSCELGP